jgi:hypothetical protein
MRPASTPKQNSRRCWRRGCTRRTHLPVLKVAPIIIYVGVVAAAAAVAAAAVDVVAVVVAVAVVTLMVAVMRCGSPSSCPSRPDRGQASAVVVAAAAAAAAVAVAVAASSAAVPRVAAAVVICVVSTRIAQVDSDRWPPRAVYTEQHDTHGIDISIPTRGRKVGKSVQATSLQRDAGRHAGCVFYPFRVDQLWEFVRLRKDGKGRQQRMCRSSKSPRRKRKERWKIGERKRWLTSRCGPHRWGFLHLGGCKTNRMTTGFEGTQWPRRHEYSCAAGNALAFGDKDTGPRTGNSGK